MRAYHLRDVLNRETLTAAHYLAYSWIFDNIPEQGEVLDFGCGKSWLPYLLSKFGLLEVTAVDKALEAIEYQERFQDTARGNCQWVAQHIEDKPLPHEQNSFDAITAVWSIQHNFPAMKQTGIALDLARVLRPGGQLFMVNRLAGKTHDEMDRSDPLIAMNLADHKKYLWEPLEGANLYLGEHAFFYYQHNTVIGDFCDMDKANAIVCRFHKC